jgi:hypothetical protein
MLLWKNLFKIVLLFPFFILLFLYQVSFVYADEFAQIPTGSIPTVTGTPIGAIAVVLDNDQGFVNVRAGPSTVEPPHTPTPKVTPTIDPTLAAQFLIEVPPTQLPTYTAPPPITMPTFPAQEPLASPGGIPMGFIIIGMAVVGLFGVIISFLSAR